MLRYLNKCGLLSTLKLKDFFIKNENFMPKKNVIAIDYSGSTNISWNDGNKKYWQSIDDYISNINPEDTQFIFWNDRENPEVVSQAQALIKAKQRKGYGGTNPGTFIQHLVPDKEGIILSIFTDGQVGEKEVGLCDRLLEKKIIKIKRLKVFFIGPKDNMNLSVSAPFMRAERIPDGGMDCEIKINEEITRQILKPALSQIEKYWGKPEFFLKQASSFLNELTLQNLGRNNQDMIFRNKLVELQKNLLQVVVENKQSGELKNNQDSIMLALQNKDEKSAMNGLKNFLENSTDETEKQIEAYFQKIFTLLDKKNDYSFDQLSANRLTRAPEVKKVAVEEVEEISSLEVRFECPITFEEDLPVLYIKNSYQKSGEQSSSTVKKYPPVFQDISKQYQDYLISNPLAILENSELVAKIKKRLDQVVGLNTTVELCKNNKPLTSLITRESISSFISTSNEPSHRRATHYALADLFFGEKLCGVPELWLAVVYFIAKNSEHLNTENNFGHFIESFKNNLMSELKNNSTYMTLSGLSSNGPLLKVPVAMAVWYCVVSPKLDNRPNRLRTIGTKHHLNLLDELDYPYDGSTLHQLALYQTYASMLKQAKQDPKKFNNWVRSLYQNSLRLSDNTLIMLDGAPKHDPNSIRISPENIGKPIELSLAKDQSTREGDDLLYTLSVGEILALTKLVDPSKKVEAIDIPNNFLELAIPASKKNYNNKENTIEHKTEICPLTLRPYSIDPVSKNKWQDAAEEKFGPLSGQISAYNYFIRYVTEEEKFPSLEELIKWLVEKQTQRQIDPKDTLPESISTTVNDLYDSYTIACEKLFSDYSVQARVLFKNYEKAKEIYDVKGASFTLSDMLIELFKEITEQSRGKDKRVEFESKCNDYGQKATNKSAFFANTASQVSNDRSYDSSIEVKLK